MSLSCQIGLKNCQRENLIYERDRAETRTKELELLVESYRAILSEFVRMGNFHGSFFNSPPETFIDPSPAAAFGKLVKKARQALEGK